MTRIRAALHELRCAECRVTWKSWAQRLARIKAGFTPLAGCNSFPPETGSNLHQYDGSLSPSDESVDKDRI